MSEGFKRVYLRSWVQIKERFGRGWFTLFQVDRSTLLGSYALWVQHWASKLVTDLAMLVQTGSPSFPGEAPLQGMTKPKPLTLPFHLPGTILSGLAGNKA